MLEVSSRDECLKHVQGAKIESEYEYSILVESLAAPLEHAPCRPWMVWGHWSDECIGLKY